MAIDPRVIATDGYVPFGDLTAVATDGYIISTVQQVLIHLRFRTAEWITTRMAEWRGDP